jgi:hypothetical protein
MEAYTVSGLVSSRAQKNVAEVIAPFTYGELKEGQRRLF